MRVCVCVCVCFIDVFFYFLLFCGVQETPKRTTAFFSGPRWTIDTPEKQNRGRGVVAALAGGLPGLQASKRRFRWMTWGVCVCVSFLGGGPPPKKEGGSDYLATIFRGLPPKRLFSFFWCPCPLKKGGVVLWVSL